jgi:hypothetical protein
MDFADIGHWNFDEDARDQLMRLLRKDLAGMVGVGAISQDDADNWLNLPSDFDDLFGVEE